MYCPESVPLGVVIVIVPFTLFDVTCRLTCTLHLQSVSMLINAIAMLASSLAGFPSGSTVVRVAKSFLFAALAFLDFGSPTVFHSWESPFGSVVPLLSLAIFCWGWGGRIDPALPFLFRPRLAGF